eukprot:jgi/Chrpa1/11786/Chrysochromulina_OHIO_Genome00019391-RA
MAARTLQSGLLAHPQFMRVDILVVHNNRRANATKPAPPQPAGQPGTVCRLSDATEQLDVRDCPGVRLLTPTPAMRKVSLAHAKRVIGGGVMSYNQEYIERGYVFLWKWELFRLGRRYDAVLHTDLDTDVLPRFSPSPHALAAEWAVELTKLVSAANSTSGGARALDGASSDVWGGASHDSAAAAREPLRMLGYADVTTPYNGGMFLVLPPNDGGALYREGLQVLGAPWNATHGWELAGTPSHLFAHTPMVAADGAVLNRHHPAARYHDWTGIDSGDLDQGFLLYMLQHRHRAGAYVSRSAQSSHRVIHYVSGTAKPWLRILNYVPPERSEGACARIGTSPESTASSSEKRARALGWETLQRHAFLRASGLDDTAALPATACGRAFRVALREMNAHALNRSACCAAFARLGNVPLMPGNVRLQVF